MDGGVKSFVRHSVAGPESSYIHSWPCVASKALDKMYCIPDIDLGVWLEKYNTTNVGYVCGISLMKRFVSNGQFLPVK